ncbi:efflux RND transporter periplasmic adaptor subunit [Amphritea sp. 1_MG-2023]|uniref:efflux RND transporter periplasmic adaptor subunit n=1 Tax=Amphritea sp. 1_MG-2023 TaxID=3062670 RepID=UPI0026E2EA3C|nr:efflux RND transporter periplasmic adaptor subunit [Amphritea sp. 1_MG-2023]MDO6564551.1 efflux RND transporter periplasmic adaptor subunit [Amphritea sp. 1_MG-2023]
MQVLFRLTPISILAFLMVLTGCSDNHDAVTTADIIRPAKIFQVANPTLTDIRSFPAEVEANGDSKLAFRVNGQVAEVLVRPGHKVQQGQLLARLDQQDYKLSLDDRQARYQLANSQFERAKTMLERKLISQSSYDEASAELKVALTSYNVAKTNLEYTYLRAPFSGTIAKVEIDQHENIQANQTVLLLQTSDHIDITIQLPENIISRVKADTDYQPTVVFDTHPDQSFLVEVKEWDTQADPSTLTYKVVFSMPTPTSFNVLPGMAASIKIDVSKVTDLNNTRLMLPVGAVFVAEGASLSDRSRFIWKYDPQTQQVHQAKVTVGEITQQGIVIESGIVPGDQVIAVGASFLSEGQKVRPWTREAGL